MSELGGGNAGCPLWGTGHFPLPMEFWILCGLLMEYRKKKVVVLLQRLSALYTKIVHYYRK